MGSRAGRWFAGVVVMSVALLAGVPFALAQRGAQAEEAEDRVEKLSGALEDLKKALKLKPRKAKPKQLPPLPLARAQTAVRIGFVDVSGLLHAVPAGKQAVAELKTLHAASQARLTAAKDEVKRLQAEVKAAGARLTAAEMAPRAAELRKKVLALGALYARLRKELNEEEDRRTLEVKRAIRVEAAALATRAGLTAVLDKADLAWGHGALDLTAELIVGLGGTAAVASNRGAPAPATLATVDPQRALQGCREGRAARAALMSVKQELQHQLDRVQKEVREYKAEFDRVRVSLGVAQIAQRTHALQEKMAALQKAYAEGQKDLVRREQTLLAPLHKRVTDVVARLAPLSGHALVLAAGPGLAHAGTDLDLTAAVIRALDGEEVTPSSLVPLEAAQFAVLHPENLARGKGSAADQAARVKAALQAVGASYRVVLAAPVFVAASVVDVTPEVARRVDAAASADAPAPAVAATAPTSESVESAAIAPSPAAVGSASTESATPPPTAALPAAVAAPSVPPLVEARVLELTGALEDLKKALKLKPSKGERKQLMAAMKTLKKQLVAAKKALKAAGGTAAASGAASSSAADAGACAQGLVKGPDTAGNCCWPGQEWSVRKDRCLGVPTCPAGLQADGDACAAPKKECPSGQVANADTANHCCWPGQEWSKGKSRCIGTPECPGGLKVKGEECRGWGDGVLIGGGTYTMGHRKDPVTVAAFELDRTPVTVAAYSACVDAGKCPAVGQLGNTSDPSGQTTMDGCNWGEAGREQHPIDCVFWTTAKAYCEAQGKRLPTEEEWEWAARGGDEGRIYPWGNEAPSGKVCWSGAGKTCPVSSYPAGHSKHGIHDLAGNVDEWTSSVDTAGVGASRVVRGKHPGGWAAPSAARAADRSRGGPSDSGPGQGFRCARSAP